jgi:hypothetical protein
VRCRLRPSTSTTSAGPSSTTPASSSSQARNTSSRRAWPCSLANGDSPLSRCYYSG